MQQAGFTGNAQDVPAEELDAAKEATGMEFGKTRETFDVVLIYLDRSQQVYASCPSKLGPFACYDS